MKAIKFFEMGTEELNNKLNELKAELFNLRFKHATNQLSNPAVMVECKRNIAKVKTILRQRELGISAEPVKKAKKAAKK
ncbi:MAG: 50S ribosomal protein L29 [Clostridiales bacterium]|jgi:large subunit ribosomal protein L29|nr:50S ribosomal protein L29 [Clostridiales bacterium]MDY4654910.1 50S ribosomal protein L29 [Eubacteriales bacterium]